MRERVSIEHGCIADYHALARYHYRTGPPATHVRTLRAVDRQTGETIGALVVSMPTLDGVWRDLAWPGRYTARGQSRRTAARRINEELRTISRVVIDPRWRGLGIATRLVRTYLRSPMTSSTEAVAAMGAWCPFFDSAGMRAYRVPMRPGDMRLEDALSAVGLAPLDLLRPRARRRRLVIREVRRWTRDRKSARDARGERLYRIAATALMARPVAYAHTKNGGIVKETRQNALRTVPEPVRPHAARDRSATITLFMSAAQRRRALAALRAVDGDPAAALLKLIGS